MVFRKREKLKGRYTRSLRTRPDDGIQLKGDQLVPLTSFGSLNELILAGWGDVPQDKVPADWRERRPTRQELKNSVS